MQPGESMALTVAEIDQGITDINVGGQSFTLDGMTYTRGNVAQLVDIRNRLQKEAERSGGKRPPFRAFKMGSMGYSS